MTNALIYSGRLVLINILFATLTILSFQGNARAGFATSMELPEGFTVPPITDSGNFQMVGFWDMRDRNTFFQVTNTSGEDVRIHIQLFDVENECSEFDYFDTLTPFDTHVYNVAELDRNNGVALAPPDLSGSHGIFAVTHVAPDSTFFTGERPVLTGNMRIQDASGYEYRTNIAGSGIESAIFFPPQGNPVIVQTEGPDSINFNDVADASFADIVVLGYQTVTDPGGIRPTVNEYNVRKFDDQENPVSCSPIILGCSPDLGSGGVINVGINQAVTNSRVGPSLCLGTDETGFIQIETSFTEESEPEQIGEFFFIIDNLIIYSGLNNNNGVGSMDAAIRSFDFEVFEND